MNLIPISRPIQIAMPGQVRFQPPARTDDALYQGLSSFGKSIGGLLDDYFQRQALQATVPTVEEIGQYESPPEEKRQSTTQPATDQFVYGDESFAAPQQGLTGPVQPPTQNPYYAQGYRYKMGDELLYEQPSPDALAMRQATARADLYGNQGDVTNEMYYRRLAEANQAKMRESAWGQVDTAATLDAAIRAHNDIPDGLTSSLRQRDDGMYELLRGPTGGQARVVTVGDQKAVQDFLRRDVSPENYQAAEEKAYTRNRQAGIDSRAASMEARQLENLELSKVAAQRQLVAQQLAVVTDELTLKPGGPILSEDQFKVLRMKQDALREQLLKMDAVGPSGGLGPTGGGSQAAPNGDSVKTPEFANYLTNLERDLGLPNGVMASLAQQESNWRNLGYHYKEGPDGRRVAPNGNVSTASGIFGILDSTATDPGYGVTPLSGPAYLHTPEEQARFAAEYLAARIDNAGGSVELGLAGYGEGARYAKQVQGRLAAAPNVAPQQGLTGQVAVGPATATPNPYAKEYEAYKAPKPLSVKEQSELAQLVNEELKMMNTDALSPADLNALKSEIARNALVRAGRLPPEAAVDPFVQASTGAQKQPGPAVPQQGFGAVLADTTKGLQTGAEDKALRTEQLRYRQELKRVHDSLGWFEANKASPMAAASAKQAVALIEGLWPTPLLTDTDRAAAKQTLSSLLLLFPELRSTQ